MFEAASAGVFEPDPTTGFAAEPFPPDGAAPAASPPGVLAPEPFCEPAPVVPEELAEALGVIKPPFWLVWAGVSREVPCCFPYCQIRRLCHRLGCFVARRQIPGWEFGRFGCR